MKITNINAQCDHSRSLHGGKKMRYVDPDFKSPKVKSFIQDLITTYGYRDYHDIPDTDKTQLVALLNEAGGVQDEWSCLVEPSHADMTISSFRRVLNGNKKEISRLVELLMSNAIDYYESIMIALFEEAVENYEAAA